MLSITGRTGLALVGVGMCFLGPPLAAAQDAAELRFSPTQQTVSVGDEFEIGLIARSVTTPQLWDFPISSMSVILNWDKDKLELLGINDNGPYDWGSSGFIYDAAIDNLNEGVPYCPFPTCPGVPDNDGNGLYGATSRFPPSPMAQVTTRGLLITSFRFRALEATDLTEVTSPLSAGNYTQTYVMSGRETVTNILVGFPVGAGVEIVPEPATLGLLAVGGLLFSRRRKVWVAV